MNSRLLHYKNAASILWHHAKTLWTHSSMDYPVVITLETSTACNRRCGYCPQSTAPMKQEFVGADVVDAFLASLHSIRYNSFVEFHFYNEPLLNEHLPSIVHKVSIARPKTTRRIFTNGDNLTALLTQDLILAGVNQFIVSRHPPFSPSWDYEMKQRQRQFPGFIKVLKNQAWSNRGGLVSERKLPSNTMKGVKSCFLPYWVCVTINGDVVICCQDYNRKHVMGNILRESLHDIWYSNKFRTLRRDIAWGRLELPICKLCTT
jgi:2-deoxy-scyllo-inosamine dehydrogenase (SAM-dependent)